MIMCEMLSNGYIVNSKVLPAQDSVPQDLLSVALPRHEEPPLLGAGLLQTRFLTILPPPHVAEQLPKPPHAPQFPFTENNIKTQELKKFQ